MRTRILLLAATLGLAACRGGTSPAPGGPVVASGMLRITDPAGGAGPVRLADLQRLLVDGAYAGEPGAHAVRVDVTAPTGVLFTQLRGPLAADATGHASSHRELQVRGTPIADYHMTGAWKFTLLVDDAPLASATI